MLFNSLEFFVFLIIVFGVYWQCSHRIQNRFLLIASYVFYSVWSWKFSLLMAGSTVIDYVCGLRISETTGKDKVKWRTISIIANLSILGFFKYFNFFIVELTQLLSNLGLGGIDWRLSIILPVGISFYTFQTMSYSWDVYRGDVKPVRNFWDFALFVSFFPQLVAGPIERAKHLIPQVLQPRTLSRESFYEGGYLIFFGLFKKVYIADVLAKHVDTVFSLPVSELVWVDVILGGMLFAFQIYCDFSGYTDIARGVSRWLGFDIMLNFKLPYFSTSPSQFWKQWHISLSTWLRDYLYIPLGGNRGGVWKTFRNLMITMLLGGLWHGANWTFLIWGGVHGLLLCGHHVWSSGMQRMRWFRWLSGVYLYRLVVGFCFFLIICITWIIFRAESWMHLKGLLTALVSLQGQVGNETIYPSHLTNVIWLLFIIQLFQYWKKDLMVLYKQAWIVKSVVYVIMATKIIEGMGYHAERFIYFQF